MKVFDGINSPRPVQPTPGPPRGRGQAALALCVGLLAIAGLLLWESSKVPRRGAAEMTEPQRVAEVAPRSSSVPSPNVVGTAPRPTAAPTAAAPPGAIDETIDVSEILDRDGFGRLEPLIDRVQYVGDEEGLELYGHPEWPVFHGVQLWDVLYRYRGGELDSIRLEAEGAESFGRLESVFRKRLGVPLLGSSNRVQWSTPKLRVILARDEAGAWGVIRPGHVFRADTAGSASGRGGGTSAAPAGRPWTQPPRDGRESVAAASCSGRPGPFRWSSAGSRGVRCRDARGRFAPNRCCG
jgi:hypothetical protein